MSSIPEKASDIKPPASSGKLTTFAATSTRSHPLRKIKSMNEPIDSVLFGKNFQNNLFIAPSFC